MVRMMDDLFGIYGTSSIVFILAVAQKHSSEEIIEAISNVVPHKKEDIMTAVQQLQQRGMATRYASREASNCQEYAF
jgi:hypothetical protein